MPVRPLFSFVLDLHESAMELNGETMEQRGRFQEHVYAAEVFQFSDPKDIRRIFVRHSVFLYPLIVYPLGKSYGGIYLALSFWEDSFESAVECHVACARRRCFM
jgi:hypothetical protein